MDYLKNIVLQVSAKRTSLSFGSIFLLEVVFACSCHKFKTSSVSLCFFSPQYMSFPASSPERAGLVPVISLLLQFSPQEAAQAGGGSAQDSLLWPSSRPAKELKIRVLDPVRFSNHNDAAVSACPKS